ncbi:MAG TPA: pitrilysin family protein [Vicinamibacterales bacterium]|nr:pitrilysin family protein [Vicinamibacterales bacterium]
MHTLRTRRGLLFALALVAAAVVAPVAQERAGSADVPRLAFEKYTLPNGLDVILSEDKRLPRVAVNLWYHVGPANEEPGRTGFAHLFEHMMFQSSKHVPADGHIRLLEAAGATGLNGTTDFDRTNYFETVPADQIELALWLESDRMGYLLDKVDVAALANQQDVVRNERRQSFENRPYGISEEVVIQTLYPKGHPYYGSVIGSHEDIQAARLDDVKRFFKQYYAPNNASLAIVGDFDRAAVKKLVEKYFGPLKRGPSVPPIKAETPKITAERRKVVKERVELPRVYIGWLTSPIFKPGDAEADIAATILGGGRSSRLYKKLVYEKQIAQTVAANQQSLILGSNFQIEATARPGHTAEELEKAIDEELAAFHTQAPDAREVERARNTIETNLIGGLERLGGFGGVADRLNSYNHYLGTPDYLQKDIQRYRSVTAQSVLAFAREQLQPNARAVVHTVPGQPEPTPQVPTPPAPKAATGEGAESINADEPWRNQVPKAGSARPLTLPTPQQVQLSNGLTVMLSERKGMPMVSANLVVRTGSDANPLERPGLANLTAAMLREGTATRNALQIADEMAQLGATLGTNSSMDSSTVTGRSLKKNFAGMLELLADVAQHPSFPAEEIARQRASRLAQLVQQRDSSGALAGRIMARVLYGSQHPYGYSDLGTEASVKAITREDMVAFWKQNFVPNNAALVVAGDISLAELRAMAEKHFGSWQRGTPASPALGSPSTAPVRVVIVDKPGAPQTSLRVVSVGVPRSSPDVPALDVMNHTLGGLFSSRINMNLREEHGYTYGASSQFVYRKGPGPFVIGSDVRTDVTAPAVSEIFKEVRAMLEKPLTAEELTISKDSLTRSLPGRFETSGQAAGSLSEIFIYNLGLDYFTKNPSRINAVTADQALAAAKNHVIPARLIVIAVGDRAKIEPELKKLDLGALEIRDPEGRPLSN